MSESGTEQLENGGAAGSSEGAVATPEVVTGTEPNAPPTAPEAAPPKDEPQAPDGAGLSAPKASSLNRLIARFIDILIALLLSHLPDNIGFYAGVTYVLIADGFMGGGSPGKRIIGLKVTKTDGRPVSFRESIMRNTPLALLYMLYFIPVIGWLFAGLGLAFEFLLIIGSPRGMRLGDEIASTVVIDTITSKPSATP